MVNEISIGDTIVHVACNAFTPIVFSREFSVERADGSKRPKDINEDVSMILEVTSASRVAPIVPLLEVFYACAKTADPKTKPFNEWIGDFPPDAYDLERSGGWSADVMEIVKENFFSARKGRRGSRDRRSDRCRRCRRSCKVAATRSTYTSASRPGCL